MMNIFSRFDPNRKSLGGSPYQPPEWLDPAHASHIATLETIEDVRRYCAKVVEANSP